jgi:predicted metal-dependent hydrolase
VILGDLVPRRGGVWRRPGHSFMPEIQYTLQRNTRSRNIRIRIVGKGEVVVSAPPRAPEWQIRRFVEEQREWILKNVAKVKSRSSIVGADQLQLFGKIYDKEIDMVGTKIGVVVKGSTAFITPVTNSKASIEKAVVSFLKTTAEKYIRPRTQQLGKKMQTTFGRVTLREQQTRWGSCSSEGNLNFNWRLVHHPPAVIDYVIIHELAHRTHMDHSPAFWELVAKYDPEYMKHRGWLKRQGMALG